MNYYAVYQLFIEFGKEKHLAVCENQAESGEMVKKQYLEEIHPNDVSRQDFIEPYLSVYETDENGYNSLSQDDIDDNRKRIGRWL